MMIDACTVRWMTFTTGCALTLTTALGGQSHAESLDASYTISSARIRVGDITATVGGGVLPTLRTHRGPLSLETGLLVEGGAAVQVARLVDAVLRVARSL
jgi:hypothetical protein